MSVASGAAFRKPSDIPGFGLALGFTLTYLSLIVLIPLAALVLKTATLGWPEFWKLATDPRTVAALRTSFGLSLAAAPLPWCLTLAAGWRWQPGCARTSRTPLGKSSAPSTRENQAAATSPSSNAGVAMP